MQTANVTRFEAMDPSRPLDPELLGLGDFVFRDAPYGMKLRCGFHWEQGSPMLEIILVVPDRDTGKHAEVMRSDVYPRSQFDEMGGPTLAREMIRRVILHELDESMYVGDVRLWDPHHS